MAKAHDPERGSALRPFGRWGMRKKLTAKLVVAIGILGIAVPLLAALYLAHSQSMEAEMRLADTMVGEVLRRADAAGDQARAAYERLRSAPYSDTCSDLRIALLRDIDMA
jgi:sensor c-di-GMP phosphodiesterase-like protein